MPAEITIVGAGLSGRLIALSLLRHATPSRPAHIRLLDRAGTGAMGPAYTGDPEMLLNVPAVRMGALSQDPENFLQWCRARGLAAGPWDFLPRSLYRQYVFELLDEALRDGPAGTSLEHVQGEATDVEVDARGARVQVIGSAPLVAGTVVLALGNFPPRHPAIATPQTLASPRYVRDPWPPSVLDPLSRADSVFLIGTGQTTVDLVAALDRRGHQGRVVALSRRGLLPLPHGSFDPYPPLPGDLEGATSLRELFARVRRHLDRAAAEGTDPRCVIDSLRPATQELWARLEEADKRRFLRYLFRRWEIIRSRIPPQSQQIVDAMQEEGRLEIRAGRIEGLRETGSAMEVRYRRRGAGRSEILAAALVVNCTGPESDVHRVDQPLVRNLLRRGLIRPGPAGLGLDARSDGALVARDGVASPRLFTLGSTMRGVLWEVLAVPEIRAQAEQLAPRLLAVGR
jgi:uncharacterized NAD(P)/FAD-binding protein YdhS